MTTHGLMSKRAKRSGGFSLIELVIVVVIIAIIGAIAIPKMSRGAAGAADSAVLQDLSVLRSALDLYQTENGGAYPTIANMPNALLQYNDGNGGIQAAKDATHVYGPYLRAVPPLPVGAAKGSTNIAAAAAAGVGWIYNAATGSITTNTTASEMDAKGVLYSAY
jgi:prepilin-type N-terminal cleavage/methylation domain-containing protein